MKTTDYTLSTEFNELYPVIPDTEYVLIAETGELQYTVHYAYTHEGLVSLKESFPDSPTFQKPRNQHILKVHGII